MSWRRESANAFSASSASFRISAESIVVVVVVVVVVGNNVVSSVGAVVTDDSEDAELVDSVDSEVLVLVEVLLRV